MDLSQITDSKNPEVTSIATKFITHHTCQILRKGGKYGYSPTGSGVFAQVGSNYFLFTASHVLELAEQDKLFVLTRVGMILIAGDYKFSDLKVDNGIDVAYVVLDKNFAALIKETYRFLPQNQIQLGHIGKDEKHYLTMGFPAVNIKQEGNAVITGSAFYLHHHAKQKVYEHYKVDFNTHFIIEFSGKGTNLFNEEKVKVNSEPHGMSGCGLWVLEVNPSNPEVPISYFLIGIMTEYKKSKYHVLVGNRIDLIAQGIKDNG